MQDSISYMSENKLNMLDIHVSIMNLFHVIIVIEEK